MSDITDRRKRISCHFAGVHLAVAGRLAGGCFFTFHDAGDVGQALGQLKFAAVVLLFQIFKERFAVLGDVDVQFFEGCDGVEFTNVQHGKLLHGRVHLLVGDLRHVGHVVVEARDHFPESVINWPTKLLR